MGGRIVQHLYLYFHRSMQFDNKNLFMVCSSVGNSLSEEDNTYYNEKVNGNFISYGFSAISTSSSMQYNISNFTRQTEEYIKEYTAIFSLTHYK